MLGAETRGEPARYRYNCNGRRSAILEVFIQWFFHAGDAGGGSHATPVLPVLQDLPEGEGIRAPPGSCCEWRRESELLGGAWEVSRECLGSV